jgi:hypothetical protein
MPTLLNRTRPDGPSLAVDLYSRDAPLNSRETYRRIRDAGAAVWLPRHRMWAIGRYRDVRDPAVSQIKRVRTGPAAQQHTPRLRFLPGGVP